MSNDTPRPERVTLANEERDDYSDLTSKWRGASESARRAEHHWPADCLAEAADLVDSLAAREQTLREEIAAEIDRAAMIRDRSAEWRDGMDEAANIARGETR